MAAPKPVESQDPKTYLSAVIFEYARRIGHIQNRESLLDLIADMGRDLVGASRCSIWLVDHTRQELTTRVAHGSKQLRVPLTHGFVGKCVQSGDVVVCNSYQDSPASTAAVSDYRTESLMTVPMRSADGQVIGAFQALNKPGGFSREDASLLELAATYSASTLEAQSLRERVEEARRLEQELEIAREVQLRLLPPSKVFRAAGCEIFGLCRPASEVGGDFFAYLPITDDSVVLAAGDVSGKGISAALMMASTQATLRGLLTNSHLRPTEAVEQVNQTVYDTSPPNRYSTLVLAYYDSRTRLLTTVNAGHCPPILLQKSGSTIQIGSDGPPVGLLCGLHFGGHEYELSPGDTLVLYSDGISECHNTANEIWPEEEFLAAVEGARRLSVEELANAVMSAADHFSEGAPQHDDMTVVCLRLQ